MIRTIIFALFLATSVVHAQTDTTYTPPEPEGGIERLALVFYTIEFTPEQRQLLVDRPMEFFFYVSDAGEARLESTNGTNNPAIIDSLMAAGQRLPPFIPATRGGVAVQSLYMMELTFPSYVMTTNFFSAPYTNQNIGRYRLSDFDTLSVDRPNIEIVFGGFVNGFAGTAGDFLSTGGGFKVDMIFFNSNFMYVGMNMTFSGNPRRRDYRIDDDRSQGESQPTLFLGGTVGQKLGDFLIQIDADMVVQNVVAVDPNTDEEPVQFWGFSPGLIVNYPIGIGSRVLINHYNSQQYNHYLNLHAGYRQLFMGDAQANGGMWELGLSWRFGSCHVHHFKLREGALEKD